MTGNRVPEIDANIVAWIEGHEPAIRQANVQCRRNLRFADIPSRSIAGKAGYVSDHRYEIRVGPDFEEGIADPETRHDLPLTASQRVFARRSDQSSTETESPVTVNIADKSSLERRITYPEFLDGTV